jgi:tetratricopeptide (TPR) repeat protein
MYGYAQKTKGQIEADSDFIQYADKNFNNDRKEASNYYCKRGWSCFHKGILDTAMFRFNQAWLLDSTNAGTYWGFGVISGSKNQPDEALSFLMRAYSIMGDSSELLTDIAFTHLKRFAQKNDIKDFNKANDIYLNAVRMDNNNAFALYGLATINFNCRRYPLAWEYLHRTMQTNSKVVKPEFLVELKKVMPDPQGIYK